MFVFMCTYIVCEGAGSENIEGGMWSNMGRETRIGVDRWSKAGGTANCPILPSNF